MLGLALLAALVATFANGCAATAAPYQESRALLGTTIAVTLYGQDQDALANAAEDAFAAMEDVEDALDPYDPDSAISAINADPYAEHPLPEDARAILRAIEELGVQEWFDPALWGVTGLYAFGEDGAVPDSSTLDLAVQDARAASYGNDFVDVVFGLLKVNVSRTGPGLDFGGAAKGLALDRAVAVLSANPAVEGALVSAGSSTVALGAKPDGSDWRIGIEDPREPGRVLAAATAPAGPLWVSTSGDYQQYFERDGVRYHHILDPATGRPAAGLRSITVIGADTSGLATDILSTALFVAGPESATDLAQQHGIAAYLVDAEGRALVVPGPQNDSFTIEELDEPLP